jgi:hypothetical protein
MKAWVALAVKNFGLERGNFENFEKGQRAHKSTQLTV